MAAIPGVKRLVRPELKDANIPQRRDSGAAVLSRCLPFGFHSGQSGLKGLIVERLSSAASCLFGFALNESGLEGPKRLGTNVLHWSIVARLSSAASRLSAFAKLDLPRFGSPTHRAAREACASPRPVRSVSATAG
jgi:hypothetical protein